MGTIVESSPFHRGERQVQSQLGVREQVEELGQRFIRDHMPDEHREFYEKLPLLLIGSIDADGSPWASMLVGRPGFIRSPDAYTLDVTTSPVQGDPLVDNAKPGSRVGVLGIEYHTRRRNRLTASVAAVTDEGLSLRILQTFGNCPQFIQSRVVEDYIEPEEQDIEVLALDVLDDRARQIVAEADHFFIASYYCEDVGDVTHGADVSHRGGKPGFVRIEDDRTLVFPDFAGNNHYNTIGNLQLNPRAGLLFVDFDTGDMLYLTCAAEIVWDSEEKRYFTGAQRLVRFRIEHGYLASNALPVRWQFREYSPSLDSTGSWDEVEAAIAARRAESEIRNYRVSWVEQESAVISSFYLVPDDGDRIHCHKAGQFLPIEINPPGYAEPIRRTYTISNAPNGEYYRLSIKREPAPSDDVPPGVSSNYFHDHVRPGSIIRAYRPRGHFVLVDESVRPVVLLSGGVGITPMISMLEQLHREAAGCGCTRKVWFIHGAIGRREHAFRDVVRRMAAEWPCLSVHFAYSDPGASDEIGRDFDSTGYISMDLLKSLLPLDDYDFFFCGPPPFMQAMYDGLKELNIPDNRIHYEFFGPGKNLREEDASSSDGIALPEESPPVDVTFSKSGITTTWDASRGTLLELAESEGLNPVYSCRSGICSTCQIEVLDGRTSYVDPPVADPGDNSVLICCSYPAADSGDLILDI